MTAVLILVALAVVVGLGLAVGPDTRDTDRTLGTLTADRRGGPAEPGARFP
jgi:hypothetical protein